MSKIKLGEHFLPPRPLLLLFMLGLGLKVFLCFWIFDGPLNSLFTPFFRNLLTASDIHPWGAMSPDHFPYGSTLLLVLYLPLFLFYRIFSIFELQDFFLQFGITAVIKLVLLGFDLILYSIGRHFQANPVRWILVYWLNPVLIYISYVHGQFDVVSMAFLLSAAVLLNRSQLILSGLVLACGLHAKFHLAICVPLFAIYIWNQNFRGEAFRKISIWAGAFFFGLLVLSAPLAMTLGDVAMGSGLGNTLSYLTFGSPEAQRLFALKSTFNDSATVYWGIFIVLLVMARLIVPSRISSLGFIFGLGQSLTTLLLVTNPSPGWYFWCWPFFALLMSKYPKIPLGVALISIMSYFLYFIWGQSPLLFWTLTALQTTLAGTLILMEVLVLNREAPLLERGRPFFIGIAGDSGAGKDQLTGLLQSVVGPDISRVLAGDSYHRWERGHDAWNVLTHLNPKANALTRLLDHARELSLGRHVQGVSYDHHSGKFTPPQVNNPERYVFIQGLHTFFSQELRSYLDLKIFLDPEESLRKQWKLQRDSQERGHSPESILQKINQRDPDSKKFIQTQKQYADWSIQFRKTDGVNNGYELLCSVSTNTILLDLALALEEQMHAEIRWPTDNSIAFFTIYLPTPPSQELVNSLAETFFGNLRPLTRGRVAPNLKGGFDGVIQLLFLGWLQTSVHHQGIN